ncbi:hypothetical protein BN1002_01606 [Bacillus sp. B-jedd]|nr:hypothetical protein BN1002_01606 [Bacillus sp. B-jedd]
MHKGAFIFPEGPFWPILEVSRHSPLCRLTGLRLKGILIYGLLINAYLIGSIFFCKFHDNPFRA